MEMLKSSKTIAAITTVLFVGALFWLMATRSANSALEDGLEKEKLTAESLLSEKLLLEKELQKIKEKLVELGEENREYDGLVKSTTAELNSREADYNRMKKENLSVAGLKRQHQELVAMRAQLENEIQSLKNSYADLESKNRELNLSVASLQEQNRILKDDLNKAMVAAVDQSLVKAVRGKNEKLTIRAKRTQKLIANFEVPANLKTLTFRITDGKGKIVTTEDGTIASTTTPSDHSYLASSDSQIAANKLQKVEMVYLPKERLKTGIYTVEILNENLYVGSLKVKLK